MDVPIELVAFIGIVLGVIIRTYFPYLRKVEEARTPEAGTGVATPMTFDMKYIVTALLSGLVTAIFVYPTFVFPEDVSLMNVFIAAFIFSWGANDVLNRLVH